VSGLLVAPLVGTLVLVPRTPVSGELGTAVVGATPAGVVATTAGVVVTTAGVVAGGVGVTVTTGGYVGATPASADAADTTRMAKRDATNMADRRTSMTTPRAQYLLDRVTHIAPGQRDPDANRGVI
jgi:hypothetical protein